MKKIRMDTDGRRLNKSFCKFWFFRFLSDVRYLFSVVCSLLSGFCSLLSVVWCLVSVVFFIGCLSTEYNAATNTQDVYFYSTEREVAIGRNISKQVALEYKISLGPEAIARVNRIGEKVVEVCGRKEINYYFYVIEDEENNAFSLPGGYVYIHKGLLDLLNDGQLAFVLAHEVAHIVSRHSIKRLQAALGYNLLVLASQQAGGGAFAGGVKLALAEILSGYSREDEFTADELAVKYLAELNFDPRAGIEVLEELYRQNKKEIRPLLYFRTHPYTAQRIKNIKEVLHLPTDVDDYINF